MRAQAPRGQAGRFRQPRRRRPGNGRRGPLLSGFIPQRLAAPVKRPASTKRPANSKRRADDAPAAKRRPEAAPRAARELPSRDEIRRFIQAATGRVGKREIARAFKLGPEHQVGLKGILKSLAHEGQVAPAGHKRFTPPSRLPETTVVVITGTDPDGDPVGRPVSWPHEGPPPLILMHPEQAGRPALAPGGQGAGAAAADRRRQIRGPHLQAPGGHAIPGAGHLPRTGPADADGPQIEGGMAHPGRRNDGRRERRDRACGAPARLRLRTQAGANHRTARAHGRCQIRQPDLHPHPRHSAGFRTRSAGRGEEGARCRVGQTQPICATCR